MFQENRPPWGGAVSPAGVRKSTPLGTNTSLLGRTEAASKVSLLVVVLAWWPAGSVKGGCNCAKAGNVVAINSVSSAKVLNRLHRDLDSNFDRNMTPDEAMVGTIAQGTFSRKSRGRAEEYQLVEYCAIPGLKIEISTPLTKACQWGPRTWGTRTCAGTPIVRLAYLHSSR